MLYVFDTYYWKLPQFNRAKAELVVAQTLAEWATSYRARIMAPTKRHIETMQEGELPESILAKEQKVAELLQWIRENSATENLYYLKLFEPETDQHTSVVLFDHHDTASAWVLNLSIDQFYGLQKALSSQGLPADLFYDQAETIIIPFKVFGVIPLGHKCYSPNEWRSEQDNR